VNHNHVVIDIETVPCLRPGAMGEIRASIKPPGNISKQESIDKWMAENADEAALKKYHDTGLDGGQGEIVVIGVSFGDQDPVAFHRDALAGEGEAGLLARAFEGIRAGCGMDDPYFIGHYAFDFDLRFIYHRAVINRVEPPFNLNHETRYNGDRAFDTHIAWCGGARDKHIGLARLCGILGIPVKTNGIDGAHVWDAVQQGRIAEVVEYCLEDVNATREVYKRLTFHP
jgi:hypothetical protein